MKNNCERKLSFFILWTNVWWNRVSYLQLNLTQSQLYLLNNIRYFLCSHLSVSPLISIFIRENPCRFFFLTDCFGKEDVFLGAPYINSNFNFHCADAEEVWPAVSAFPWAKLLCRCPLKHGDENRKLL